MLESIICLPILLFCIMAIAQFAQIWITKHIVFYSAFCAARATLTCNASMAQEEAKAAAKVVLLNLTENRVDSPDFKLELSNPSRWAKMAEVKYTMPLMVPIAGEMIAAAVGSTSSRLPSIVLKEKCLLPCPYDTSSYPR